MALADYFSKDLLAISQALKKGSNKQFQDILNNTIVGIAFDDEVEKTEGKAALDLTVRLLSRLYPKLNFITQTANESKYVEEFTHLAKAINSKIQIVKGKPNVVVSIGNKILSKKITDGPIFYIGSDEWFFKFSTKKPVGSGNSVILLGAGFAACIGASNIFRCVFENFMGEENKLDTDLSLSLIDLFTENSGKIINKKKLDLGEFILVGFGAIGNGAVWALNNSSFIKGELTIIEPEKVETTNLQRYVLAQERHIEKPKIDIANEYLNQSFLKLKVVKNNWVQFLKDKNDWRNKCVLIAIDNIRDRIAIQSSLPNEIINSYTENNLIGISHHFSFIDGACLMCTYMPHEQTRSYSQEVSENLGLAHLELQIRQYLFYNKLADEQLIKWVAEANSITYSDLERFIGVPVREFYSKIVCGGILIELRKDEEVTGIIEAPLSFQSALAGILMIAELIISRAVPLKEKITKRIQLHPLYPIENEVNPHADTYAKDNSGRCICCDDDFIKAYKSKWKL